MLRSGRLLVRRPAWLCGLARPPETGRDAIECAGHCRSEEEERRDGDADGDERHDQAVFGQRLPRFAAEPVARFAHTDENVEQGVGRESHRIIILLSKNGSRGAAITAAVPAPARRGAPHLCERTTESLVSPRWSKPGRQDAAILSSAKWVEAG